MTLFFLWLKVNWRKTLVSYIGRLGELVTSTFPTWVPRPVLPCRHEHPKNPGPALRCSGAEVQGGLLANPGWTLEVPDLATATGVQ